MLAITIKVVMSTHIAEGTLHCFPPEFPSKVESPFAVHHLAPERRESRVASSAEFVYVLGEWRCQNSPRIQGGDVKILLIGDVKILHSPRIY